MKAIKVGLITFGDHRADMWDKVFGALTMPRHARLVEELKKLPIELVANAEPARSAAQIDKQADHLKTAGVDVLVAHTPCWTSPNLVVRGVQRVGLPTILVSNVDPDTHGPVGVLAASGALKQIGYPCRVMRSEYSAAAYEKKLLPEIRGMAVPSRLRGLVMGLFGGRSIGIDTVQFDPMQWRKLFAVDAEHIDQLEIIRLADKQDPAKVRAMREKLEAMCGKVVYDGAGFTPAKFEYQLACYLATKQIIKDKGLDFIALKCMPELSDNYVPQCLTQAFLTDSYDVDEGEKEPIVVSCEADADAALTQQILKIISGGKPTFFADLSHFDNERKVIYLVNCGAQCCHYACRSQNPADNLKGLTLSRGIRPSGGAQVRFIGGAGPMLMARLYRVDGKYKMGIIPTEALGEDQWHLAELKRLRGENFSAVTFIKAEFDFENFFNEFGSNHISGVAGEYLAELLAACRALNIEPVVFSK